MNPAHQDLYEALADAAGSGRDLSAEWEKRLGEDPKLRSIADRFERTVSLLGGLREVPAPSVLEGRVVSTLQAGHREDRVVESLRALTPQEAPDELEALVAESIPGVSRLEAPPELDERIDSLLRDWEGAEEHQGNEVVTKLRPIPAKAGLVGLAAAASLLFAVVLAAPWESEHEKARQEYLSRVEILPRSRPSTGMNALSEALLAGVTGGLSDVTARGRFAPVTPRPRVNRRTPATGRGSGPANRPGTGAQSGSQNSNSGGSATAGRSGADVLTKLSDPEMTPHQGTRRVSLPIGPDSPLVLTYREQVSVADDGTFAIDPLDVIEPQMSPETSDQFQLLQKTREGFFHRFRDFRIRDISLFTEQYTTIQSFNAARICDNECIELDIQRTDGQGYRYLLWVEPVSGLCLKAQEYDATGWLAGEFEYEDLDLSPSLATSLSGGPSVWAPIDASSGPVQVLHPLWVPGGFVLESTETRTGPQGDEWVMQRYTDGIEMLFVVHTVPTATTTTNISKGPEATSLTRVFVHEVGSWMAAEGDVGEMHLFVLGKLPEADLAATLASTAR